ncbi:tetratricopeptide repeat protein [Halalkalibacterium ligniniphilum]|uniref:tetratricopeptide repeat protein n=1 Tax=Halalkalibacterium ligniniphilum TaxID=1134413 RepID=UPI0003485A42|nr:tetratricopeptide repeat protein [Halalkalibacterium ligniniphilum]
MDDKQLKRKDNVVLYPGLVKRLIEKGMDALKDKDPKSAIAFFKDAEAHEPDHPQVLFGKVLCLIELGQLEEAVALTDTMLREDIGTYYDNLQVHISLLVQLGRYDEVVEMLDAVLSEERLPPKQAESFYQLLHFSRQMTEDTYIKNETSQAEEEIPKELFNQLESVNAEQQWNSIQLLKKFNQKEVIRAFIQYVENKEKDSVLRSYVLQLLSQKAVREAIHIEKDGRKMKVVPAELSDYDQQQFGMDVIERLGDVLETSNPSLYQMATQLWWHYLFILYPFLPMPVDVNLWTAAVTVAVHETNGVPFDEEEIAEICHCDTREMLEKAEHILEQESQVFQGAELDRS